MFTDVRLMCKNKEIFFIWLNVVNDCSNWNVLKITNLLIYVFAYSIYIPTTLATLYIFFIVTHRLSISIDPENLTRALQHSCINILFLFHFNVVSFSYYHSFNSCLLYITHSIVIILKITWRIVCVTTSAKISSVVFLYSRKKNSYLFIYIYLPYVFSS